MQLTNTKKAGLGVLAGILFGIPVALKVVKAVKANTIEKAQVPADITDSDVCGHLHNYWYGSPAACHGSPSTLVTPPPHSGGGGNGGQGGDSGEGGGGFGQGA